MEADLEIFLTVSKTLKMTYVSTYTHNLFDSAQFSLMILTLFK